MDRKGIYQINRARERSIGRRCKEKGVMNNERNIEEQNVLTPEEAIRRNNVSTAIYQAILDVKKKDQDSMTFYNSSTWKRARDMAIARDGGIDVWEYMKTGRMIPGNQVHHIQPLSEAPELGSSLTNLITLSLPSHREVERLYNKGCRADIQAILQDEVNRRNEVFFKQRDEEKQQVGLTADAYGQYSLFDGDDTYDDKSYMQ